MCTPVSQCHVHAEPGSDVPCPCTTAPSAYPARELLSCPVPNPTAPTLRNPTAPTLRNPTAPTLRNPTAPTLRNRTSDPDTLSIFTLLACHHSSAALSIHLSLPHWSSPPHFTFPSMTCVLKRFLLTSPPKLPLTCVKRGFLRTAEPRRTSQLSPCSPLMSQCHVHAVPGSDVPCPIPSPRCHRTFATLPAPAPG